MMDRQGDDRLTASADNRLTACADNKARKCLPQILLFFCIFNFIPIQVFGAAVTFEQKGDEKISRVSDSGCDMESDEEFNTCLMDFINDLIPTLTHDLRSDGGMGIDPLMLGSLNISHLDNVTDISLMLDRVEVRGLTGANVESLKSHRLYMGKIEMIIKIPRLELTGYYESEGEMATFPLSSSGPFNITLEELRVVCILHLEGSDSWASVGDTHHNDSVLTVTDLRVDAVPARLHILPAPYFDGDNKLGELLNNYLNENSLELYNMMKPRLMDYTSETTRLIINSYLVSHPTAYNHLQQ